MDIGMKGRRNGGQRGGGGGPDNGTQGGGGHRHIFSDRNLLWQNYYHNGVGVISSSP